MPVQKFLFLFLAFGLLSGCLKDSCEEVRTFQLFEPVTLSDAAIAAIPAKVEGPKPLSATGRFYYYDHYVFISSPEQGVHIVDNADPKKPVNLAYIALPGNSDMTVRNGVLYTNLYSDLIGFDVRNAAQPVQISRSPQALAQPRSNGEVIIGWEKKEKVERFNCNQQVPGIVYYECATCDAGIFVNASQASLLSSFVNVSKFNSTLGIAPSGNGTAGSMSQTAIVGDYLYTLSTRETNEQGVTISADSLIVSIIGNNGQVRRVSGQSIPWANAETLFPKEDKLYLGTQTGMLVYGLARPDNPDFITAVSHVRGCDPVVVHDQIAYVTIHGGTPCGGNINQLQVFDVSNLQNVQLLASFGMYRPMGLAYRESDKTLFICEDDQGLKVFDASVTTEIGSRLLSQISGFKAFDVIALPDGLVLVIGADGLYQYDLRDPRNPVFLSKIAVNP